MLRSAFILTLLAYHANLIWAFSTFESIYDAELGRYCTQGVVIAPIEQEYARDVGADFGKYSSWALKNINGDPGINPNFIALIRNTSFDPKLPKFSVIYDLNLIWPFDREDQVIDFNIKVNIDTPKSYGYILTLREENVALTDFILAISVEKIGPKLSRIDFSTETKLTYLLDQFVTMENYKKNVEWRLLKVLDNLQNRLLQSGSKEAASITAPSAQANLLKKPTSCFMTPRTMKKQPKASSTPAKYSPSK